MSDTKKILSQILSDEKLLNSKAFRNKVYTDEPIIRTASQLRRPELPQKIRDMRSLAHTQEAYWKTSAWLFCKQGEFMKDYDDLFDLPEPFSMEYPTYRDFSNEQLRAYFSWRSLVRNGDVREACLPFAMMYMYELLNLIGVDSPEDALDKLRHFGNVYSGFSPEINLPLRKWTLDMLAYYRMPVSLAENEPDILYDRMILGLMDLNSIDDDVLFSNLEGLSSYKSSQSGFVTAFPEDFKAAACRSFRVLADKYDRSHKSTMCEKFFGKLVDMKHRMFDGAVFMDKSIHEPFEYVFNEIHSISFDGSQWKEKKLYNSRGRSSSVGNFMKAVDFVLRELTGYRFRLGTPEVSKMVLNIIKNESSAYLSEKKAKEIVRIDIDLSALGSIRRSSDIIREKLLVDEDEGTAEETDTVQSDDPAEEKSEDCSASLLNAEELAFLAALINNEDWKKAASDSGSMPSLMADSINDKLFDSFGDTVIDYSSDQPEVISDYEDELRQLFNI